MMRAGRVLALALIGTPAVAQDAVLPSGMPTACTASVCAPDRPNCNACWDSEGRVVPSPPVPAQAGHRHTWPEMVGYWTLGGLHVADLAYTQTLLLRGWGREGNPAVAWATEHPGTFTALKWTAAGAGMFATWHLFETGHPRLAWLSIAGQAAITGWAVVHNHRIFSQCRQPGVTCR